MLKITIKESEWSDSPRGCDCIFLERGGFGFKLYRSKLARNNSFLNQAMLARNGFAPKCWEPFLIEVSVDSPRGCDSRWFYGFVSELVHTLDKSVYNSLCYGRWVHPYVKTVSVEVQNLQAAIKKQCGMSWGDTNYFNAGITDDGRLVVVDCAEFNMVPGLEDVIS